MFLVAEALTFRRVKQHCLDRGKQPPKDPYRCQFEYVLYHARPEEKKRRAMRNSHRARLGLKEGGRAHPVRAPEEPRPQVPRQGPRGAPGSEEVQAAEAGPGVAAEKKIAREEEEETIMSVCGHPSIPNCVSSDPALGFNMAASLYGAFVLALAAILCVNGVYHTTGETRLYELTKLFFRGLGDIVPKVWKSKDTAQSYITGRASGIGNAILYTGGFVAVLLPTLFISDGATIDSMSLGVFLFVLICLYFATGQYRGIAAPTSTALVVHQNPTTVEEARQLANAKFLEGAQSALGGAVLGALVALVVSLARFFEVRPENRFGDTMYIVTGVGLGVYLVTYYGSTLKRRDAGKMDVEQFERSVSEYLRAHERLKRVSLQAKEARDPIKQEIDALQGTVMGYMAERGIGELEYGENVLLLKESRRANTLNKKSLLEALQKYFRGDGQRAEACLEFVLEEIGTRTVSVLSRRKVKKATKTAPTIPDNLENEAPPDLVYDSE
ncbi:Uncharacterized protein SCF082_LOCUS21106 [Durusdinium trenchii]|uniref:H(+)-exporting diphosphatase n=1 Tax=Durusdinium trenchii TaxID=1381693 RepID=A0ABP0L766_9DINO